MMMMMKPTRKQHKMGDVIKKTALLLLYNKYNFITIYIINYFLNCMFRVRVNSLHMFILQADIITNRIGHNGENTLDVFFYI